jgi:hypothetical protein
MRDNKNEAYDVGVIKHKREQKRGEKVHWIGESSKMN